MAPLDAISSDILPAENEPRKRTPGGEIYYVSPRLSTLANVELPIKVQERANQIIKSEEELVELGARAVEQMWTVRPSRVLQLNDATENDLEGPAADWFDEEWFEEKASWDEFSNEKPAVVNHIRLLPIISELVRNCTVHSDAVIFFEEGGMVGLAPIGTRVGDIVCRIEDLDTIGILREHGDNFWMVAKAMPLSPLAKINKSCQEAVFDVDVEHMRVLCRI